MECFFEKLSRQNPTSVILALVEPYCENFIPKVITEDFPKVLTELKDENCLDMSRSDLIHHCERVASSIECNKRQQDAVESATKDQSQSKFWNTFRTGRVTASQAKAVCTCDPENPSASLVKRLCYPAFTNFKNQATKWGNEHEKIAVKAFTKEMKENHESVDIEDSGFVISTEHPYLGASPDAVIYCDCCRQATVELKCPFKHQNEDLENCEYLEKDCNGDRRLKINHPYYFQVQTQLGCLKLEFGYFVVWTPKDMHVEQIVFDKVIWDTIAANAKKVFQTGLLPELVGRYYSRLPVSSTAEMTGVTVTDSKGKNVLTPVKICNTNDIYCHCQKEAYGKMIACDNQNCKNQWFHYECVGIKRKPRGEWYCSDCKM